ncbi:uncharacterized protein LOC124364618 [Homalodisca vitripennis]|uniref:uncharacterized protein LOC124364618 n=1 Tax=Homalodisca vitripennis TaxID=197043 RepID=UPI001EEB9DA9|nr:uncharacterized protein LOC124364618 [Homalodisca vitripennis]
MLSVGYFLEKHLLKLPIIGTCGFSAVYTPNQSYLGPKICIDFGLNVATATNNYYHLKTNYTSRIVVNFGNTHNFNSSCNPIDVYFKMNVAEVLDLEREILGEVHNVYRTEQCDQDLKVSPSSLTEIEHISTSELERISISFSQLPEGFHHKLNDILKAYFPQHTLYESLLAEEADETKLTFIKKDSQYYLDVNHPSVNTFLKDVALDLHPDVIQFCHKFCKYLMHNEIL